MRLALASDHAGFALKSRLVALLRQEGHEVADLGTTSGEESVDYPQFAAPAAQQVADGEAARAIVVCGSGVGVAIAANKVPGVRAVNGHDPDEAELARRHTDANVLTLAGRRLDATAALPIVHAFLTTEFEGGRHARRVEQITALET
jgi:ribose 5-phosphate isomerase B